MAEAAGTAVLVGIGTGAIVFGGRFGPLPILVLCVAWFAAVTVPVVGLIRISGAHLNPAVTVALAASRRIDAREAPAYVASQLAGAFAGSLAVLATLGNFAHLGATLPSTTELPAVFALEAGTTAVLVAAVFVLSDRGAGRLRWRLPLPGLVVAASTHLLGPITGSSLNPARSLAPAILSGEVLTVGLYVVAPLTGALVVAALWRPRSVDRLNRGPGRLETVR